MSGPDRHFADVEAVLVAYLTGTPGIAGCSTELPGDPVWPWVVVTELPIGRDDHVFATAAVDLDVFHVDRGLAKQASRAVHAQMLLLRHSYVDGVPIGRVDTEHAFGWVDYDADGAVHRYVAQYEIESAVNAQIL